MRDRNHLFQLKLKECMECDIFFDHRTRTSLSPSFAYTIHIYVHHKNKLEMEKGESKHSSKQNASSFFPPFLFLFFTTQIKQFAVYSLPFGENKACNFIISNQLQCESNQNIHTSIRFGCGYRFDAIAVDWNHLDRNL